MADQNETEQKQLCSIYTCTPNPTNPKGGHRQIFLWGQYSNKKNILLFFWGPNKGNIRMKLFNTKGYSYWLSQIDQRQNQQAIRSRRTSHEQK